MKKPIKTLLFVLAVIFVFTACDGTVYERRPSGLDPFDDNPITITWKGEATEVQSFQTNVYTYSENNRNAPGEGVSGNYRMAVSAIGDRTYTRIDMEDEGGAAFRSFLTDGEEFIAFNPVTGEIGHRIIDEDSANSPLNRIFGQQTGLSRLNLSLIRAEAQRLSLDMTEEGEGDEKTLLLEIPPGLIPQNGYDRIIYSRVSFDLANETLLETEVKMIRGDDTVVITTVTPVYEEYNGVPVKIGQVTEIDSKAPGLTEGIDSDTPVYNSPDEIPVLSAQEFAQLETAGNIHEISGITFGDPADASSIETIHEVYLDIEINSAPEQLFRLIRR